MKYGYYSEGEWPLSINKYRDGSHIIVVRNINNFVSTTIKLEDLGWAVRDCIKILMSQKSVQATLLRKPFKGTVANNVLTNGCGGLNIGISRIIHNDPDIIRKTFESPLGMEHCARNRKGERGAGPSPDGRFPANLILIHSNCKNNCNEGCPVIKLDLQSGNRKGWHSQNHNNFNMYGGNSLLESKTTRNGFHGGYNDSGGASRFFKQFHSLEEVKEYLTTLICC